MKIDVITFKKFIRGAGTVFAVILTTISALLCFSINWMFHTWSNLTMDELMFHITAPLEGTNESMIQDYLISCVSPTIVILIIMVILFSGLRTWRRSYLPVMLVSLIAPFFVAGGFILYAWNNLDVSSYVEDQGTYSTFIDDNYVDPADVELEFPEQKRNLIYIFLESMETTFSDEENGGGFEKNTIPELTKLAHENEDFSGTSSELNGGFAMPGSTWTIGAMFSQTSGIPLNISIESNSMETQDTFFAGAVTLGDLLKQEGYSQSLMIGSDAVFGGRQLYFTEHGNYDILDYEYAKKVGWIPQDYRAWWGYEDEKLYKNAKLKLTELAKDGEPFNLTLLTVDTHFEDGYSCSICPKTFTDNSYANVMSCASKQVADFVSWIQAQSFYDNTSIVISGDHPTMDSDFCEDIDTTQTRKVYTTYINSAVENQSPNDVRDYTTFDNFPTTLASMGVSISGNRLGLGTNLFSGAPTLSERFGKETESRELSRKSALMEDLANIDEKKQALLVNTEEAPEADITVGPYDRNTATFPVVATNLQNIGSGIESLLTAVWTEPDQSDLQWIPMELREDGLYYLDVDITSYGYKTGDYQVHVYMTDVHGNQFALGAFSTAVTD